MKDGKKRLRGAERRRQEQLQLKLLQEKSSRQLSEESLS